MRFWKIIVLDTLGVALMILAILTGWLPGPGGIPLFILGLSLLAIHHEWAQRYIDLLKKYADRLGDMVFVSNPHIQAAYDILSPGAITTGTILLYLHNAMWQITLGVFLIAMGLLFFLGNRHRFKRLKQRFKH